MFKTILVPTDGSAGARRATHAAVELARLSGGKLIALHVVTPQVADVAFTGLGAIGAPVMLDTAPDPVRPADDNALNAVRAAATEAGVPVESCQVTDPRPAEVIANTAQSRGCDVIVMSSSGYGGLLAAVTGSMSGRVFRGCDVPVLLVHEDDEKREVA